MKFASFRYERSTNLGDEVQTLAVEQHLPHVDCRVDRDSLAHFEADEPHVVVMQGWFSHTPRECFPPSRWVRPVFVGFHLDARETDSVSHVLSEDGIAYLRAHEPIGCRDRETCDRLRSAGIDAYTSHCLTLTFERRARDPRQTKTLLVHTPDVVVPRRVRAGAVPVAQDVLELEGDSEAKFALAAELLRMYREEARLVVTTKLHAALPCIAMGVPVVFFGDPDNGRLGILTDIGVPIHRRWPRSRLMRRLWKRRLIRAAWSRWTHRKVDWDPAPVDIDDHRRRIRAQLEAALRQVSEPTPATAYGGDGARG